MTRNLPPKRRVTGAVSVKDAKLPYRETLECGHRGDFTRAVPQGRVYRHCWECFFNSKPNPT